MTEMVTSGSMSGEGKRSDGLLRESDHERRRLRQAPPVLHATALLLDSTDAVCVKFKDLEAYRAHMRAPHGPDEATHLRENVARITAFDIITPDEPADTKAKIIELYKERWTLFPDVAKVLREEVDARLPYL
jgi:hypothetical protein